MPAQIPIPPYSRHYVSFKGIFKFGIFLFIISSIFIILIAFKIPSLFSRIVPNISSTGTPVTVGKVVVDRRELEEMLRLEEFLSTPDEEKTASVSADFKESLALGKVVRRKILESETESLGVSPKEIKKDAEMAAMGMTADGRRFTDRPLNTLYIYNRFLVEALKEKVEGWVESKVVTIGFQGPYYNVDLGKKLANIISEGYKTNRSFDWEGAISGEDLSGSGLTLNTQDFKTSSFTLVQSSKVGTVSLKEMPMGFSINVVTEINEGLLKDFDSWYETVKRKYQ